MSLTRSLAHPLARPLASPLTGESGGDSAYVAAVKAAGGTPPAGWDVAAPAIDAFVAAGWLTGFDFFYLHCFANADANLINMVDTTSLGAFVGGVSHDANGFVGNGSTGYLDTETSPADAGVAEDDVYAFALTADENSGDNQILLGCQTVSGERIYLFTKPSTNELKGQLGDQATDKTLTGTTAGIAVLNSDGTNVHTTLRTGAGRQTDTEAHTNVASLSTKPIYIGARNGTSGDNNHCDCTIGASGVGVSMTDANDALFTAALKTLWETCTGASLP